MKEKEVVIIYNPISGRLGRRASRVKGMINLLSERGVNAEAHSTQGCNHATELTKRGIANGAEIVMAYGGDGTVTEVVQGIVGSHSSLAVWPGGTANVLARELDLPWQSELIADMVAAGKKKQIALGRVRADKGTSNKSEQSISGRITLPPQSERYFVVFAGIGLYASIAQGVNSNLKRLTGKFAFWVSGISQIFNWRAVRFTLDANQKRNVSMFALIANGKSYGGGMCLTPNAKLDEPFLEVYISPPNHARLILLRDFMYCFFGNPGTKTAKIIRSRSIAANPLDIDQAWVQVDGEVIGHLPMSFDIVPNAISIIVP